MGTLKDVNTTSIEEAIRLGCHTMQNVFDADDNHIPFFRSVVYPASEAHLGFSAHHSESHVPGRHLNALLNAADLIDVDITEAAIEKHRRAAFLSFSGPVALALTRPEVGLAMLQNVILTGKLPPRKEWRERFLLPRQIRRRQSPWARRGGGRGA